MRCACLFPLIETPLFSYFFPVTPSSPQLQRFGKALFFRPLPGILFSASAKPTCRIIPRFPGPSRFFRASCGSSCISFFCSSFTAGPDEILPPPLLAFLPLLRFRLRVPLFEQRDGGPNVKDCELLSKDTPFCFCFCFLLVRSLLPHSSRFFEKLIYFQKHPAPSPFLKVRKPWFVFF